MSFEQFQPGQDDQEVMTQKPNPFVIDEHSAVDRGIPVQPEELFEGHSVSYQRS